jgi:DNA-binding NarL/FixJ family response regulator
MAHEGHHFRQADTSRSEPGASQTRRVVIIEDELFVAMDIEAVVMKAGHEVVGFAGTAESAVAIVEQTKPDLVLMDIRLAGERDGIDAAIEIRERFGIPSLIISGNTDAEARERSKPARPIGFIAKPFDRNVLMVALGGGLKP